MGDFSKNARVTVYINGANAASEIDKLTDKVAQLRKQLKAVGNDSDAGKKIKADLKNATEELSNLKDKAGLAQMSIRSLEQESRRLRALRNSITPGTEAFKELDNRLKEVNTRLNRLKSGMSPLAAAWKQVSVEAKAAGLVMLAIGAKELFSNALQSAGDLSDQMADVRKTTGLTTIEMKALVEELSKIDTRTSRKELLNIAIVAGQLGIAKDDIAGFVKAVDFANVALGDEFGGNAQAIATEMGKLRNIFTDIKSQRVDQDLLHIGNALNVLGSVGAATGPVISENANRIGGYGIQAGLTTGQVLGLSAAQEELNISSERGGTAIIKILQKMLTNVDTFASVAGVSVEDFKKQLDTDLFGAFMKVVEGSKQAGNSNTKLAAIIKELDVDGAGASEVMAKFGSNLDLIKTRSNQATEALKNTTSITQEFNLKNQNAGAVYDGIKKSIAGFFNSTFVKAANGLLVWAGDFLGITKSLSQEVANERKEFIKLEFALNDSNIKSQDRVRIIKELQTKYPAYLGNLDAEKVTTLELNEALKKVNQNLINRIVLARKQEQIDKAAEQGADNKLTSEEAKFKLQEKAVEFADKYGYHLAQNLDILRAFNLLQEQVVKRENKGFSENRAFKQLGELRTEYFAYQGMSMVNTDKLNKLESEKIKLAKELGIVLDDNNQKTKPENVSPSNAPYVESVSPEDKKAAEKQAKEASDSISKANKELYDQANKILKDYTSLSEDLWNEVLSGKTKSDEDLINAEAEKWNKILELNAQARTELNKILSSKTATPEQETFAKENLVKLASEEKNLLDGRERATNELEMKLFHERLKLQKELNEKIEEMNLSEKDKEIKQTEDKYNQLAAIAADQKNIDLVTQIEELKQKAIQEVKDKYAAADEEKNKERLQKQLAVSVQIANELLGVWSDIGQIKSNKEQTELDKDRLANDQKKKNLDRQLKLKLISQDQYNNRVEKLDEDLAKKSLAIKQKQAARDKKLASFQAAINMATAIIKFLADPGGWEGVALAAGAAITGGIQIGKINSEPIPQFGKGTIFGGLPHSSNPSMDGNPIIDRFTGRPIATVEKGEMLLSANFVRNNPELSQKALSSSQNENGRRITPQEIYGRPSPVNISGASQSIAINKYRDGAYFEEESSVRMAPVPGKRSVNREFIEKLDELINEIKQPRRNYIVKKDLSDMEIEENFFKKFTDLK